MGHNEAMDAINSLIGRAWLVAVFAVVFLVVVNGFKVQPRSVREAAGMVVLAVREAVDKVVARSGHLVVWFALALMVPYSVLATLNMWGVFWVLVVSFVLFVLIELAQLVGKIWRKLRRGNGDPGAVPVTASKAKVAAVVAGDTIKAVRADVAALSQEVVSLRETISVERDETRQELAELRAKVRAIPEQVRTKHDLS